MSDQHPITRIDPTGWMVIHPKQIAQRHRIGESDEFESVDVNLEYWSEREYNLHGFHHPSVFNLFRNARKQQTYARMHMHDGERFTELSKIVWFDARYLPQVTEDEIMRLEKAKGKHGREMWRPVYPGLPDRLSEIEFAERQMHAWAARAAELRKAES